MAESKFVSANEEIAEKVADSYKKIEEGVVGGFTKMIDKFVGKFLVHDGETVEEAKARLEQEKAEREAAGKASAAKRAAEAEARHRPHKP